MESRREGAPDHRLLLAACSLLALALAGWWIWNRLPPPQIGEDEDVFKTVDALFTAVTSRDEDRLADCEERLHASREEGRLADSPAHYLDGVIDQARAGQWDRAARQLYAFMYGQRGG
jgi:hypothetical protein